MVEKKKVIIASGYFDPLHSGHVLYLNEAKKLGDYLIVMLNNESQSRLKKGFYLMSVAERKAVLEAIKHVDEVMISIDDGPTCSKTLSYLADRFKNENAELYFVKSGEWNEKTLREAPLCNELGIKMVFLDSINNKVNQSSTNLIKRAADLHTGNGYPDIPKA
jgi:D-beta-D-heptose 7-phosphate kinase/D-beta-D-heptose 1-phosphate adenosyltransferase